MVLLLAGIYISPILLVVVLRKKPQHNYNLDGRARERVWWEGEYAEI